MSRRARRTTQVCVALVIGAACATVPSPAAPGRAPLLRTCTVQGIEARCGSLAVPESRDRPGGRQIRLRVVVLPSRAESRSATPSPTSPAGPAEPPATASRQRRASGETCWRGATSSSSISAGPAGRSPSSARSRRPHPRRTRPGEHMSETASPTSMRTRRATARARPPTTSRPCGRRSATAPSTCTGRRYGTTVAQVFVNRHPHWSGPSCSTAGRCSTSPSTGDMRRRRGSAGAGPATVCRRPRVPQYVPRLERQAPRAHRALERGARAALTLGEAQRRRSRGSGAVDDAQRALGRLDPARREPGGSGGLSDADALRRRRWLAALGHVLDDHVQRALVGLEVRGPWGTYLDGATTAALESFATVCPLLRGRRSWPPTGDGRRRRLRCSRSSGAPILQDRSRTSQESPPRCPGRASSSSPGTATRSASTAASAGSPCGSSSAARRPAWTRSCARRIPIPRFSLG